MPSVLPLERARLLDALARDLASHEPSAVCAAGTPTAEALAAAHKASDEIRARMIAVQEELDWEVYRLYGLIDEDLTYGGDDLPRLALGERAFEIALARAVRDGEEETAWFTRHGSTPITEIPEHWPAAYRDLVQRRLELIAVRSVDPVAGKARVQASLGAGVVGEASGAGAAWLAAGSAGGPAVLVRRAGAPDAAQRRPVGR